MRRICPDTEGRFLAVERRPGCGRPVYIRCARRDQTGPTRAGSLPASAHPMCTAPAGSARSARSGWAITRARANGCLLKCRPCVAAQGKVVPQASPRVALREGRSLRIRARQTTGAYWRTCAALRRKWPRQKRCSRGRNNHAAAVAATAMRRPRPPLYTSRRKKRWWRPPQVRGGGGGHNHIAAAAATARQRPRPPKPGGGRRNSQVAAATSIWPPLPR